jgi:hypothetical protein
MAASSESGNSALRWRKAQRSVNNGACVEIAVVTDGVVVRDSQNPDGTALFFPAQQWSSFLGQAKAGRFDSAR